jgi:hypothetical protein
VILKKKAINYEERKRNKEGINVKTVWQTKEKNSKEICTNKRDDCSPQRQKKDNKLHISCLFISILYSPSPSQLF